MKPTTMESPIGVRALMEHVKGQIEATEFRQLIKVKGKIIGDLRPFPKDGPTQRIYGELGEPDGQMSMSFVCSAESAPSPADQFVVLQGALKLSSSKLRSGFELQLVGDMIGRWTPAEKATIHLQSLPPRGAKVPLNRFISSGPEKHLVLIGTERGIQDASTTFARRLEAPLETRVIRASDCDTLLREVRSVVQRFDGFCLMRGGGDPPSFVLWSDPQLIRGLLELKKPFYAAIGHSTDVTLLDKYADDIFATPSDFGASYAAALEARSERLHIEAQIKELHESKRQLQQQKDSNARDRELQRQKADRRQKALLGTIALLSTLLLLVILLLVYRNGRY